MTNLFFSKKDYILIILRLYLKELISINTKNIFIYNIKLKEISKKYLTLLLNYYTKDVKFKESNKLDSIITNSIFLINFNINDFIKKDETFSEFYKSLFLSNININDNSIKFATFSFKSGLFKLLASRYVIIVSNINSILKEEDFSKLLKLKLKILKMKNKIK